MTGSAATTGQDRADIIDWLLAGDPAVRWQTMRDLTEAPSKVVARERSRVVSHGWGAQLLARQGSDGRWAGSLYSPKWTSTTYTLLLLHWLDNNFGIALWLFLFR